jgi:hypothetical protein
VDQWESSFGAFCQSISFCSQKMGCAWKSKQRVSYMLSEVDPDISIKGAFFFRKKSDFKTIDFKKNQKLPKALFKGKITW